MFIKHEEVTTELVYEVKVNIPPVGMVYDYVQKEWIKVPVFKKSKFLQSLSSRFNRI